MYGYKLREQRWKSLSEKGCGKVFQKSEEENESLENEKMLC